MACPSPTGSEHEAARVHHACRRRVPRLRGRWRHVRKGRPCRSSAGSAPRPRRRRRSGLRPSGAAWGKWAMRKDRTLRSSFAGLRKGASVCPGLPPSWSQPRPPSLSRAMARTARPALAATKTIPIIYQTGGDPVKDGLVASMRRGGGNVTAITRLAKDAVPKRLALLHELAPSVDEIGMLFNLTAPDPDPPLGEIEAAARALGLKLTPLPAGTDQGLATAIDAFDNKMKGAALLIGNDAFFLGRRKELESLRCVMRCRPPSSIPSLPPPAGFWPMGQASWTPIAWWACRRAVSSGRAGRGARGRRAEEVRADRQPQDRQGAQSDRRRPRFSGPPTRSSNSREKWEDCWFAMMTAFASTAIRCESLPGSPTHQSVIGRRSGRSPGPARPLWCAAT